MISIYAPVDCNADHNSGDRPWKDLSIDWCGDWQSTPELVWDICFSGTSCCEYISIDGFLVRPEKRTAT